MQKGVDYPAITVSYVCHDGKGNFLMNKRGKNARDENGKWDFGGGGLEFGEKVEECLLKEIEEEFGTKPIEYRFLGYLDMLRSHDGKNTHWVSLEFLALLDRGKVINGEPNKFDEIGWFRLDALPEPLHPAVSMILEKFRQLLPR